MEAVDRVIRYFEDRTQRLFGYIQRRALQIGDKCDHYMDNASSRKKYLCEVLLRVPLAFVIHQWLLLSPHSNYWIIEIFLFVVRYLVAVLLVGTCAFNNGVLLQFYTVLTFDVTVMWLKRIDYWTHKDETSGICNGESGTVWSDFTERWKIPAVYSILLQIVYLSFRPGTFIYRTKEQATTLEYIALLVTLIPNILSALSVFPCFMSELAYWIESVLLIGICIFEIVSSAEVDLDIDKQKLKMLTTDEETSLKYSTRIEDLQRRIDKRSQGGSFADNFPGRWFIRDTMLAFGAFYFIMTFLIEITIYQREMTSMFTLNALLEVSTMWCTSSVVVIFLSYGLGFISNLSVVLCQLFLTSEINIIEALDANIGGVVQVAAFVAFTEASILSLEYVEKLEAMKMVALLAVYAIIFQTLGVVERKILTAVNNGVSPGALFYIRVGILTGLLVTAPSYSTFIVSKHLDINPWILFFASGNCTLIFQTIFMLLECVLVSATWYNTRHLSKLEDVIHYTRVTKALSMVLLNTTQSYCRYICPFFKGWWIVRLCLSIVSFFAVAFVLGRDEVKRFKSRNRLVTLLNNLPDETFQSSVLVDDNGEEETHECAICYSVMNVGKTLPCKHTFHKDCLRRWFQVRAVCPFCNTEIK